MLESGLSWRPYRPWYIHLLPCVRFFLTWRVLRIPCVRFFPTWRVLRTWAIASKNQRETQETEDGEELKVEADTCEQHDKGGR